MKISRDRIIILVREIEIKDGEFPEDQETQREAGVKAVCDELDAVEKKACCQGAQRERALQGVHDREGTIRLRILSHQEFRQQQTRTLQE